MKVVIPAEPTADYYCTRRDCERYRRPTPVLVNSAGEPKGRPPRCYAPDCNQPLARAVNS